MNFDSAASEGVLGPIPQLQFDCKVNRLCKADLAEITKNLLEETNTKIENCNPNDSLFRLNNLIEFIFLVSTKFELPYDVKYIAVELFATFMQKHVEEIYNHVHNPASGKNYAWSTVEGRVKSQVLLRALTCLQIGSKLTSHYNIVSPYKIQSLLMHYGFRYTFNSLAQSEIRILKTLNYQLPSTTPHSHIEVLLESLASSQKINFTHEIYENSLKILDFYYLDQNNILEKAISCSSKSVNTAELLDKKKNMIRSDYVFIASSIVGAAIFVVDYRSSDILLKEISELSMISSLDLTEFATLLIQEILAEPLVDLDDSF